LVATLSAASQLEGGDGSFDSSQFPNLINLGTVEKNQDPFLVASRWKCEMCKEGQSTCCFIDGCAE
jgi:hypothetical protein